MTDVVVVELEVVLFELQDAYKNEVVPVDVALVVDMDVGEVVVVVVEVAGVTQAEVFEEDVVERVVVVAAEEEDEELTETYAVEEHLQYSS